jgi:phosphoribosylformylglycinamidine synthase
LPWTVDAAKLRSYDAFVLPGGFAYEDRVRAGAIAAHHRTMTAVIDGAARGKLILGICNGAQILIEAGLVPDVRRVRTIEAGFARNAPNGKFLCRQTHVKLTIPPERCAITAALLPDSHFPVWISHAEGRLAAHGDVLAAIEAGGHRAFAYCDAGGRIVDAPNGSALGTAALTNTAGNVLAIMPHPERDERAVHLRPSGGAALFASFAKALAG